MKQIHRPVDLLGKLKCGTRRLAEARVGRLIKYGVQTQVDRRKVLFVVDRAVDTGPFGSMGNVAAPSTAHEGGGGHWALIVRVGLV